MPVGFIFSERLIGEHEFQTPVRSRHYMEIEITWGPKNIFRWLNPYSSGFMKQTLTGFITIDGLCNTCPCRGILELKYHKGEIQYDIYFNYDGDTYHYIGKKENIRPWNLHKSHTTCYGTLIRSSDDGYHTVSKSTIYFRLSDIWDFLSSFRIMID